jgi:Double zinc ribbon/Adenylate and Guanylate cyclase catalytic domain
MRWPSCGFESPEGMKLCLKCVHPLTARCSQCGFASPPQAKFCGACGTPLRGSPPAPPHQSSAAGPPLLQAYTPKHLAEKIVTSRAALEGERKQVTVLFADIKGSMELLAERDPEEARLLLDLALERLVAALHHYQGPVNQVMGDGLMAVFGAPLAYEGHAVRACYAAPRRQETASSSLACGGILRCSVLCGRIRDEWHAPNTRPQHRPLDDQ